MEPKRKLQALPGYFQSVCVRVEGRLIPVAEVMLVQMNPNEPTEIADETPMTSVLARLISFHKNLPYADLTRKIGYETKEDE